MPRHNTILALFRDADDVKACIPLLTGIPGVIRTVVTGNLSFTLENLRRTGIEPCLTIITGRLYPMERPNLVATIRGFFPGTEFLMISSDVDPFPPMKQLAADRLRHLIINTSTAHDESGVATKARLHTAVKNLVEGRAWEIADQVKPGTIIHEIAVSSSAEKEELIAMVESSITGNLPHIDLLRQKGALLADEMLENAMYGAPKGDDGAKLYRKGMERVIRTDERIVFRYGFDGETLAMAVADGWGSLSPDIVLEHLSRKQDNAEVFEDSGGRGLFIIWRFLDHFHVTISPGRQTVVGGHVGVTSLLDPEVPRGFHISTHLHAS